MDVCPHHVKQVLEEIRCICGSWLEQRSGKFGPYFNCVKCGNLNFKKGLEMRIVKTNEAVSRPVETIRKPIPKEIIITTKDVEYFD